LRDRFGVHVRLDYYRPEELSVMLAGYAEKYGMNIDGKASERLSRCGRGTPRVALRILRRVRDFAQNEGAELITEDIVENTLELLQIDGNGLDIMDRKIMNTIISKFDGGPVSLDTIAMSIGEEARSIYEVYEPYLLQLGFLSRTPRGRVATERAHEYFQD
jgi:Holliday junction DNA helicase RuvB